MTLSFCVTVHIPDSHHFPMQQLYQANRKTFLEDWLSGALSNLVVGPVLPLPKKDHVEVVVTLME